MAKRRSLGDGLVFCWLLNAGLKPRDILPNGNGDLQGVRGAFFCIVFGQAPAEPIGLNPHDGIGILVEGGASVEDFQADGVLLDLIGLVSKDFFA